MDKCDWKNCKNLVDIGYSKNSKDKKVGMCFAHWQVFCDMCENGKENKAREKLNLKPIEEKYDNNGKNQKAQEKSSI